MRCQSRLFNKDLDRLEGMCESFVTATWQRDMLVCVCVCGTFKYTSASLKTRILSGETTALIIPQLERNLVYLGVFVSLSCDKAPWKRK